MSETGFLSLEQSLVCVSFGPSALACLNRMRVRGFKSGKMAQVVCIEVVLGARVASAALLVVYLLMAFPQHSLRWGGGFMRYT